MAQVCCSAAPAVTATVLVGLAVPVYVNALAVAPASGSLLRIVATGDALEAWTDPCVHWDSSHSTNRHPCTLLLRLNYDLHQTVD